MALISFMMILAEIQKSYILSKYCEQPALQKKVPGYKVNVGFGLHAGTAISGPIGSEFKIDATYFGHDVTLAEILEGASKSYKQKILFTGDFS